MKIIVMAILLVCLKGNAQSPSLNLHVLMDSAEIKFIQYKIEMKICETKKATPRGDLFSHELSKIDFASLVADCKPHASQNCLDIVVHVYR